MKNKANIILLSVIALVGLLFLLNQSILASLQGENSSLGTKPVTQDASVNSKPVLERRTSIEFPSQNSDKKAINIPAKKKTTAPAEKADPGTTKDVILVM